ncbi:hypothetical protein AB1L88_24185 [Tautonia sp. JC769]|uniref:hypothetical protein n=1 Tax=Tautonia sp. JC769 TaxID=3232135 RepID=UPI00345A3F7A
MPQRFKVFASVIVIAAIMGGVGWALVSGGTASEAFEARLTFGVMAVMVMGTSILLWTTLAAVLGPNRLVIWAAMGLVSPLLGGLLLLPPVSYLVLWHAPVVTFGLGLATGVLVWAALRCGESPNRVKAGALWNEV